jgi:hypothetical protein
MEDRTSNSVSEQTPTNSIGSLFERALSGVSNVVNTAAGAVTSAIRTPSRSPQSPQLDSEINDEDMLAAAGAGRRTPELRVRTTPQTPPQRIRRRYPTTPISRGLERTPSSPVSMESETGARTPSSPMLTSEIPDNTQGPLMGGKRKRKRKNRSSRRKHKVRRNNKSKKVMRRKVNKTRKTHRNGKKQRK